MNKPTQRQAEFLAFIHDYTKLNRRPPSEAEMQRYFGVTPPSVHQMVLTLDRKGFISRTPGMARSIRLVATPAGLTAAQPAKPASAPKLDSMVGHWRITQMDMWDQDFVDAEVEGYVRLEDGGSGEFQFGYVHGLIVYELTVRDGKPAAEWTWEGNDETDEAHGRGWAVLQERGRIKGMLVFHQGEKSDFVAVRKDGSKRKRRSNGDPS